MELRHLRYFTAVFVHGSFTRAAEALFISQPALSRQIKELEEECGALLFERTHAGASPTAAAHALVSHAKTIAQLADDVPAIAQGAGTTRDPVQIGLAPGLSATWLDDVFDHVRATVGHAAIGFVDLVSSEQVRLVRQGRLDIGVVHEARGDGVDTVLVRTEQFGVAAAPESPFYDFERIRFAELSGVRVLSHARHQVSTTHDRIMAASATLGAAPDWQFADYIENARACARAVDARLALMTRASAERLLDGWRWIPLEEPNIPIDTHLVTLASARPVVSQVVEAIVRVAERADGAVNQPAGHSGTASENVELT